MRVYFGWRGQFGCAVQVSDTTSEDEPKPLPPRNDLVNHSPDGFEWGYEGSGPAQLALAILADYSSHYFGDAKLALPVYQDFKRDVIAGLNKGGFLITGARIARWWLAIRSTGGQAPPEFPS